MNKLNKYLKIASGQLKISRSFKQKLGHNFHELTWLERILYFCFVRPFWSADQRFFYEAHFGLPGQMLIAERKLLYETIQAYLPRFCLEIGTYTGGGSTFFLAQAFQKIGAGQLITMEANPYYFNKAKNYYQHKLPALAPYIQFVLGDKVADFAPIISEYKTIDCVLFDGAENGQQTLDQYNYFSPYFAKGTIIILHDWNTEKTASIKPVLKNDPGWKTIKELEPPESVGMVVMERI